jgi:hypothetical protein
MWCMIGRRRLRQRRNVLGLDFETGERWRFIWSEHGFGVLEGGSCE